jgi:uncharacterized protein (TIRG00374 family)
MRRIIMVVTVLAVAIAAFYLLSSLDMSAIRSLSAMGLAVISAATLILMMLHAIGAWYILRSFGQNASVVMVFVAIVASSTISLAGDPKLGVPARLAFYKLLTGIPLSVGTAQASIETVIWLGWLSVVAGISGLLAGSVEALISALILAGALSGAVLLVAGPRLMMALPLPASLRERSAPLRRFLMEIRESVAKARPRQIVIACIALGITYPVDIASVWYLAHDLGADLPIASVAHAIVTSHLAGLLSMIPMGVGIRDVTFALLLEHAGASQEVAALIALIHRLVRTVIPIGLGLLLLAFVPALAKKN